MRRLFGVTDIKFDVIGALERQEILLRHRRGFRFWSSNGGCHKLPPKSFARRACSKYKIDNHASQGCFGSDAARLGTLSNATFITDSSAARGSSR
jgi:hypothetical protein